MPLLKPVFAVGLLAAAWTQERGGTAVGVAPVPGVSREPALADPARLVFVAGITVAVLATSLFDGGVLIDLLSSETKAVPDGGADAKPADATLDRGSCSRAAGCRRRC